MNDLVLGAFIGSITGGILFCLFVISDIILL